MRFVKEGLQGLQSSARSLQKRKLKRRKRLKEKERSGGTRLTNGFFAHSLDFLQRVIGLATKHHFFFHFNRLHRLLMVGSLLVNQDIPMLIRMIGVEAINWSIFADSLDRFSSIRLCFMPTHLSDETRTFNFGFAPIVILNLKRVFFFGV